MNRYKQVSLILGMVLFVILALPVAVSQAFAFDAPSYLPSSAADEKFDGPGNEAVLPAGGLKAELVSDKVAVWGDQIALWPDEQSPTHLFIAIEQRADAYPTDARRESVQVLDLKTKEVKTVLYGLKAADGIRVTPWGSVLVTEEEDDGQAWEILDPMNVTEAFADRAAGTSDNPNVVFRPALGIFAWEGIVVLPNGTLYAGDELRPEADVDGGTLYKFIPEKLFESGVKVVKPEESPFASGKLYALAIGAGSKDYGQGNQLGSGSWLELTDPANARAEAAKVGATGYYRPEDMVLDPTSKIVRIYWANTGNYKGNNFGEILVLTDGSSPNVQIFALGDGAIAQPDNVAIHPKTGDVYIIEDFTYGDVWVCKKDNSDAGSLTQGCGRILSVRDPKSEPTGFILFGDGNTAFVILQHRNGTKSETDGRQYDDLLMITGLNSLLP